MSRSSSSYHSSVERRVQAPLHQDLVAADGDRLFDLLEQHLARQHVDFVVLRRPVERAEIADGRAGVRVVDVAVDVVRAERLGMQAARDGIGRLAQRDEVVRFDAAPAPRRESVARRRPLFQAQAQCRKTRSIPSGAIFCLTASWWNRRQPLALGRPQSVIQVLRQVINGHLLREAQQRRFAAGDRREVLHCPGRGPPTALLRPAPESVPCCVPHMANTNGSPVQFVHSSPRSQVSANCFGGRMNRPVADQQHRIGVGPRRSSGRAAAVPVRGRRRYRSASRIRASVALVREPTSSASRRTARGAFRKYSLTLSTGPRAATQASETTS